MDYPALQYLLNAKEGENLEFKEKKHHFDSEELVKYACAIANCGDGHIVYGVTDKRPVRLSALQPSSNRNERAGA